MTKKFFLLCLFFLGEIFSSSNLTFTIPSSTPTNQTTANQNLSSDGSDSSNSQITTNSTGKYIYSNSR